MTPACDPSRLANYFMELSRQRSTFSHLSNADTSSTPDPIQSLHHVLRSPVSCTHPMSTSTSSSTRTETSPLAAQDNSPLCSAQSAPHNSLFSALRRQDGALWAAAYDSDLDRNDKLGLWRYDLLRPGDTTRPAIIKFKTKRDATALRIFLAAGAVGSLLIEFLNVPGAYPRADVDPSCRQTTRHLPRSDGSLKHPGCVVQKEMNGAPNAGYLW
jgi:hypothetical protein